jgi:transcriptional regulator with XRE-family HTH domain
MAEDKPAMAEITSEQCRAARAMLDMSEEDLAAAANVGLRTVSAFEAGLAKPTANSLRSIRLAFEAAGIDLLPATGAGSAGVRLSQAYLSRKARRP